MAYANKVTAEIPEETTNWQDQWGALDFTDLPLLFPKLTASGYLPAIANGFYKNQIREYYQRRNKKEDQQKRSNTIQTFSSLTAKRRLSNDDKE
ncbi:MAG: hypothetical protein LLG09_01440 [Negativicutes bacterium]|nr:hypothetical protein [Negativicutes bacterium]